MGMVSPNELLKAAKDQMLGGKEPVSYRDWESILNFMAANVAPEVQPEALFLIAKIYDMPLPQEIIKKISAFQLERKRCNCENLGCRVCHGKGCHSEAGKRKALYVGPLCDPCAREMPQEYMRKD